MDQLFSSIDSYDEGIFHFIHRPTLQLYSYDSFEDAWYNVDQFRDEFADYIDLLHTSSDDSPVWNVCPTCHSKCGGKHGFSDEYAATDASFAWSPDMFC